MLIHLRQKRVPTPSTAASTTVSAPRSAPAAPAPAPMGPVVGIGGAPRSAGGRVPMLQLGLAGLTKGDPVPDEALRNFHLSDRKRPF